MSKINKFLEEAFKNETDECILWPYSKAPRGAAKITIDSKTVYVCHLICEIVNGPKPSSMHEVAHSCGNGHLSCINKRHLNWKLHKENEEDKRKHGTYGKVLNEEQVIKIKELSKTMRSRDIAIMYKISKRSINEIISGATWSYLNKGE
jgi:hypothetical protein